MSSCSRRAVLALGIGGRHSRRVGRLRFILPVAAMTMLLMVMVWPWLTGGYHGLIMPVFDEAIGREADQIRMHNPRYVGRTEKQEPYEVTAASAFLDPANDERIHLDQLIAVVERIDAEPVHLRANQGLLDRDSKTLDLKGDLELRFGEHYVFETSEASVDFGREEMEVVGETPVTGEGPIGTLAADSFTVQDGGSLLRFAGRVQVVYRPEAPAL